MAKTKAKVVLTQENLAKVSCETYSEPEDGGRCCATCVYYFRAEWEADDACRASSVSAIPLGCCDAWAPAPKE